MALPESNPPEVQKGKATEQEDIDFTPTAEALVDEIDDERTLEEEEAMNANNVVAVQEELDDLKKESEMPIEELLAYYERMRNQEGGEAEDEEEEDDDDDEDEDDEDDKAAGEDDDLNEGDDDDDEVGGGQRHDGGTGSNQHRNHEKDPRNSPSQNSEPNEPNAPSNDPTKDSSNQATNSNIDTASASKRKSNGILTQNSEAQTDKQNEQQLTPSRASRVQRESGLSEGQNVNNEKIANRDTSVGLSDAGDAQQVPDQRRHSMTEFTPEDDGSDMFKSLLGYDLEDSDDMDEDYSYTDDENGDDEKDWRRSIHVGPDHQADVPEGLIEYGDLPPYENEDKLVWKCNDELNEDQIVGYLKQGSLISKRTDISVSPMSVPKISYDFMRLYREKMHDITSSTCSHIIKQNHENLSNNDLTQHPPENLSDVYMSQSRKRARIDYELEQENALDCANQCTLGPTQNNPLITREGNSDSTSQDATKPEVSTEEYFQDEEQLLFLLLQCNYNLDEALRRRKLDPFKYYLHEPMSLWSQDECLGFEHGLRVYGKNFRFIRENKVKTRTHAELVAFYYLWKKSERHDVYTNQYKLDRKRCLSHPGTTDYMDKFIEDNESIMNATSSNTPTPTPAADNANPNLNVDSPDSNPRDNHRASLADPTSMNQSLSSQYANLNQNIQFHQQQLQHIQVHQTQDVDEGGSVFISRNQ